MNCKETSNQIENSDLKYRFNLLNPKFEVPKTKFVNIISNFRFLNTIAVSYIQSEKSYLNLLNPI